MMDRIGRRLGLSLGFFLGIAGGVISVVAILGGSLAAFLVGAFLLGGMRGIAEQGRFVAAEVVRPSAKARAIGIVVFGGTLGAIGGPLLVGPSEQWMLHEGIPGAAGPFVLASVLLVIGTAILFLMLRPDPLQVGQRLEEKAGALQQEATTMVHTHAPRIWTLFQRPALRLSLIAIGISQLVMTMVMVVTPLHMDHHAHGTVLISWVIMAHNLGMYGLSSVSGWFVSRFGRLSMIVAGTLILIVAAVVTPLVVDVPLLALALFLLGLGWNICFVAGSAMLTDAVTASERGRVQGASEAFAALASGAGSVGAGFLFEWSGMVLPAVVGVVLCLVLLGATLFAMLPGRMPALPRGGYGD
jgi:MFS family permease